MQFIKPSSAFLLLFLSCACNTLAGKEETGAVIARRVQVRSSTAVVAGRAATSSPRATAV